MNWRNFRRLWQLRVFRHLAWWSTPWFALLISSGEHDFPSERRWYGVRLLFNPEPGWNAQPGCYMFRSEDRFLSWRGQR